jgi:hypothetical protein
MNSVFCDLESELIKHEFNYLKRHKNLMWEFKVYSSDSGYGTVMVSGKHVA